MDADKLEEWLCALIDCNNSLRDIKILNDDKGSEFCRSMENYRDTIFIDKIIPICRILNIEWKEMKRDCNSDFPIEVSFEFLGVKFYGIYSEEELESEKFSNKI